MSPPPVAAKDLDASFDYCRRLAKRAAKNFYYSFLTLPADVRRDTCALYAYMRVCDDLGDDPAVPPNQRREQLGHWREEVRAALRGDPTDHPALPALADVVSRRAVPHGPLLDVIAGVETDLAPVRYDTFEALEDYCYRVAGTVGVCCIHVWGFTGEDAVERAIDCGIAFQLTNILRDIGEDARMGRVYLPREDLDRFGYSESDLAAGVIDDRFRRLTAFEIERARAYYRRAEPLSSLVSPAGRPVLAAMRRIYGGLLDEIERRNYDVFSRRVALPRWRKLAIAAAAVLAAR